MPIVDDAACARKSANGPNIAAPAAAPETPRNSRRFMNCSFTRPDSTSPPRHCQARLTDVEVQFHDDSGPRTSVFESWASTTDFGGRTSTTWPAVISSETGVFAPHAHSHDAFLCPHGLSQQAQRWDPEAARDGRLIGARPRRLTMLHLGSSFSPSSHDLWLEGRGRPPIRTFDCLRRAICR